MRKGGPISSFAERQPLVLPVLALMAGLGVGDAGSLELGAGMAAAGAVLLAWAAWGRVAKVVSLPAIALAFGGAGMVAIQAVRMEPQPNLHTLLPAPASATLVGKAGLGQMLPGGKYALKMDVEAVSHPGGWRRVEAVVNVRLPAGAHPAPGSRVAVAGFYVPNEIEAGDPLWRGYRESLERQGITGALFVTAQRGVWRLLAAPGGWNVDAWAQRAAAHLNRLLDQTLGTGPEGAVAKAILLGTKEGLTDELQQTYAASGAIHLLVVSGGHLVLLWVIFYWVLMRLPPGWQGTGRWAARLGIVAVLWGFAFLAGLGPSIVRAACMLTLVQAGIGFGRPAEGLNALAGACWLMLALDPLAVHSLGFQLSVACVAGILVLTPRLTAFYTPKTWAGREGWQAFCTTIAAQAGALPITLVHFGQLPVWFWLANPPAILLTVVLLPGLLVLILLAAVASALPGWGWFDALVEGVATLTFWMLKGLNGWMEWIGGLPGALREGVFLSGWQAVVLGLALVWLAKIPKGIGLRHGMWLSSLGLAWCLSSVASLNATNRTSRAAIGYDSSGFYQVEQAGLVMHTSGEVTPSVEKLGNAWRAEYVSAGNGKPVAAAALLHDSTLLVPSRAGMTKALRRRARQEGWQVCDLSRQRFYVIPAAAERMDAGR